MREPSWDKAEEENLVNSCDPLLLCLAHLRPACNFPYVCSSLESLPRRWHWLSREGKGETSASCAREARFANLTQASMSKMGIRNENFAAVRPFCQNLICESNFMRTSWSTGLVVIVKLDVQYPEINLCIFDQI